MELDLQADVQITRTLGEPGHRELRSKGDEVEIRLAGAAWKTGTKTLAERYRRVRG